MTEQNKGRGSKGPFPFPLDMPPARVSGAAHGPVQQHDTFYLYGPIGEPELYVELVDYILGMGEHDTCTLRLNGPGGGLFSALAICNAIDTTKGTVYTCIDGEAASAHRLIWFAGHKRSILTERIVLMIHGYSSGNGGHMTRQRETLDASDRLFAALADRYYRPFLTDEEYNLVVLGKDDYRLGADVLKRIKAINDEKKAEEKKVEQAKVEVKDAPTKPKTTRKPRSTGTKV